MNVGFKIILCMLMISVFALQAVSVESFSCLSNVGNAYENGVILKNQGNYLLASNQFAMVYSLACDSKNKSKAALAYGKVLYQLSEKSLAEYFLAEALRLSDSEEFKQNVKLTLAWYDPRYVKDLSHMAQKRFSDYAVAEANIKEKMQLKKPWIAGSLSALLPGLGQIYNSNYQSAAFSFVLNSLFLAATLEMQRQGLYASSLAAGTVFSITYVGGILGSIDSAKKINEIHTQPELLKLRQEKFPELDL